MCVPYLNNSPHSHSKTVHDVPLDTKGANLTSKSDDYVWDVFYHRPATLSEWNEAANVGTLCVSMPLQYPLSDALLDLAFPLPSRIRTTQHQNQRKRMKQTKTLMVRFLLS